MRLLKNKKAVLGGVLLIGIVMFNIIMYIWVLSVNQSTLVGVSTSGNIDPGEISASPTSWTDGFRVSVFGLPDWVNYFYVSFQALLIAIGIYYSILAS